MTFLPIVGRELGVAARRPGTYWMRFGVVLAALAIWLVLLARGESFMGASRGVHILNGLGILALAFSLFAGIFQTADCLSEEKREGTMGLLFLTDLKAYDVVLGKLVANSIHAFFGLLAVFPVLGLAVLVGGVTGREFWRLLLVFVVTLFFSLGAGMFASSVTREARQSIARSFVIVLLIGGLPPLLWWLNRIWFHRTGWDWVFMPSPAYAYWKAFETQYYFSGGPAVFWTSVGTIFAMGLLGIVLATLILPRTWQDKGAAVPKKPGGSPKAKTEAIADRIPRLMLIQMNPMYWLAARDGTLRRLALRLLLILAPFWLIFYVASFVVRPRAEIPFIICMFFAYGLHQIVKVLIATEASRRINEDRRSGALELLLVTTLPVRFILEGQMRALRRHFLKPMAVLVLLNLALCFLAAANNKGLSIRGNDLLIFLELFLGGMLMLVLDFFALGWVGMWRGLNAAKHHRAVVGTVLRVMGVPWLFIFFLIFSRPAFRGPESVMITFAIWFLVGIVTDLMVGLVARERLRYQFRRVAAGRFQRG